MARIDWVEQRLLNWARWRLMSGSGVLGYAAVVLADPNAGRGGYIEALIPTSDVEASDTAAVVSRLPSELRATVEAVYTSTCTNREICDRLFISKPTLHKRIERAQRLMANHWLARQDAQARERKRVEDLVRAKSEKR